MDIVRVFEIISWFSLPTVMFGGFSLLRLLTKGRTLTPFQVTCRWPCSCGCAVVDVAPLLPVSDGDDLQ